MHSTASPGGSLKASLLRNFLPLVILPLILLTATFAGITWWAACRVGAEWVTVQLDSYRFIVRQLKQTQRLKLELLSTVPSLSRTSILGPGEFLYERNNDGSLRLLSEGKGDGAPPAPVEPLPDASSGFFNWGHQLVFATSGRASSSTGSSLVLIQRIGDKFALSIGELAKTEVSIFLDQEPVATTWRNEKGERLIPPLPPETIGLLKSLRPGQILSGHTYYDVPDYGGMRKDASHYHQHAGESRFRAFYSVAPISRDSRIVGYVSLIGPEDAVASGPKHALVAAAILVLLVSLASAYLTVSISDHVVAAVEASYEGLSTISAELAHELRTPLHNLVGEMEVTLLQDRTESEYRLALTSSLEEAQRLSRIVDGLMFLARSDLTRLELTRQRVDIAWELARLCESLQHTVEPKGVSLHLRIEEPLLAGADPILFQRALSNVIANALEYTPSGGSVEVSAHRTESHVVIRVEDTGIGIAPQNLEKIFDRFFRAEKARDRGNFHVGLGLPVTASVMEAHGGEIEVSSREGEGTAMTLCLPI